MSDDTADPPGPGSGRAETSLRMRAIAAGLQAGGLDARVHDTRVSWTSPRPCATPGARAAT
jgi:hypothetical protein